MVDCDEGLIKKCIALYGTFCILWPKFPLKDGKKKGICRLLEIQLKNRHGCAENCCARGWGFQRQQVSTTANDKCYQQICSLDHVVLLDLKEIYCRRRGFSEAAFSLGRIVAHVAVVSSISLHDSPSFFYEREPEEFDENAEVWTCRLL